MTPIHFGTRRRCLFGVYDPAHKTSRAARAAVICHPWGNEQIHAYRTLRQLAARLSRTGFHVLRFDYYGTGDSAGDTGDNDFAGRCSDIKTAMVELRDMTGIARLSLVGLRHGASLAARVAAGRADEIESLVLWDPLDASDLASRRRATASLGAAHPHLAASADAPVGSADVDLPSLAAELPPRTLVLMTQGGAAGAFGSLAVEHVASAPPWIEERMETGSIPVNVLQHIVHWLR
jgi:alpha/beta superfamily hydrolase